MLDRIDSDPETRDKGRSAFVRSAVRLGRTALFWIGVPFAILFMLGEVVAAPLNRYRNHNVVVWVLWNLLRFSVPVACVAAAAWMLTSGRATLSPR